MSKPLSATEQFFKEDFTAAVLSGDLVCEICGFPKIVHPHRIRPGSWGGRYEELNVAPLCPTHHYAVHFLIDWFMADKRCSCKADEALLDRLKADPDMWAFWKRVQWPVCMERLTGKRPDVQCRCQRCGTILDDGNEAADRKHCVTCVAA